MKTQTEIEAIQTAVLQKHLEKVAWSRSRNWLNSILILGVTVLWFCGMGAIIYIYRQFYGPMTDFMPLYVMVGSLVFAVAIAIYPFNRINAYVNNRYQEQRKKLFAEFNQTYE